MDGISGLGLCPTARVSKALFASIVIASITIAGVQAQGVVESNINVTGIGAPGYDVGQPGKQENEPSCAINPLNVLNVMCAYNWYGFADLPNKQGDTWIGFSETRDGRVFLRRALTGTRENNWSGQDFAADPTMMAWPGGAAVTSIAGIRGGNSVMLIQRMMELNTETGFRHLSEAGQIEVASISGVNFIDKPDARVVIDPQGGTQSVTMTLETGETVTREWPKFRIIVTYAVFNGSNQNIRTFSTYSDDFGAAGSWSNPQQITNSSGLDQGLSVANKGNEVLYTVRRFQAGTETDSVMGALSKNRGQKIGKVFEITDICAFDQVTLPDSAITQEAASFRTNDFPWVSATGDDYVLVYSERPRDGGGNCVLDQGTRIMVRTSQNGTSWSNAVEVSPVAGHAFQFMPALNCARGSCQVLWYDTRNESAAFTAALQPELAAGAPAYWENNPFIEDFIVNGEFGNFTFRRTADVYTSRINIASNGDPVPSAQPERVSVYQLGVDEFNNVFEREFNPLNVRNYAANTKPFMGDYIAMAAPQWRLKADGTTWESNQSPVGIPELDKVNYFGAWTDNRRVRGSSILAYPYSEPTPFSVSSEVTTSTDGKDADELPAESQPGGPLPPVRKEMLAKNVDRFYSAYMPRAEGLEDRNLNPGMCMPVGDSQPNTTTIPFETRTKDSEIYGATIEDRIRLVSPTPVKNLGQIQRAFVLGIENIDPELDQTFRLVIANQPGNAPVDGGDPSFLENARSSWRQLPFGPVFFPGVEPPPVIEESLTVPANSTDYISLFVVSDVPNSPVTVYAYDDSDLLVALITVNGDSESGDLLNPPAGSGDDVILTEIHNPGLILPVWGDLSVDPLNPAFRNPSMRNPNFRNPNFRNLDYQDPSLRNPRLRNPNMRNETTEATNVQNPSLRNPSLRNEAETDSFIDVTFGVEGANNTITAIDADFAFAGDEFDALDTQLIAWQENEIQSLQNCDFGQITENKVITAANNPSLRNLTIPDIDNNLDGSIRFPVGPGEVVELTLRIFGPRADLEALTDTTNGPPKLETNLGWVVSAQSANTGDTELNPGEEQIIRDVIPPSFNLPNGYIFVAEASGPLGALVDLTDPSTTTNGDSISAEDGDTSPTVTCIAGPQGDPIPLPGTVPVGSTIVSCTAEDTAPVPNVGTWTGTILVEDNTPPTIDVPGGNGAILLADPDSAAGTAVDFLAPGGFNGNSITVTELVSPDDVIFSCMAGGDSVESGVYVFPVGDTAVSCTASDLGPCNEANAACVNGVNVSDPVLFTVSVVDGDPPVINNGEALADIVVEATADPMPFNVPEPSFSDAIDENATISRTPSITAFPLGTTPIEWTARDFAGNESTATQNVVIRDTTAPGITVPDDITASTSSSTGTAVTFEVETDDIFPVTVQCTPESGDTFPLGTTTVDCTAMDSSGNTTADSFTVTVEFVYGTTGITTNKRTAKTGSSIPLNWAWTDENGTPMSVGDATQVLKVQEGMCPGGIIVAEDPGSSGFRIKSDLSWEYNWQAVDQGGNNLPASNPNSPYCVTVTLIENGASIGEQSGEVLLRP